MNCKPGDLAINIWSEPTRPETLGAIVTVVRPYTGNRLPEADWVIEWRGNEYAAIDKYLRPIRDPGDDAVDETLLWWIAPKQKEAA